MGKSCQLSEVEREKLQQWTAAHGTPQQVALRGRIVLAAAAGESDITIAKRLSVNRNTVILWRKRFGDEGLDGLWDIAPSRGRKPVFQIDKIAAIVDATLQTKPAEMTHWSWWHSCAEHRAYRRYPAGQSNANSAVLLSRGYRVHQPGGPSRRRNGHRGFFQHGILRRPEAQGTVAAGVSPAQGRAHRGHEPGTRKDPRRPLELLPCCRPPASGFRWRSCAQSKSGTAPRKTTSRTPNDISRSNTACATAIWGARWRRRCGK